MEHHFIEYYTCSLRAVSTQFKPKEKPSWSFMIDFIDSKNKKCFTTPSIHVYDEPEDAIQDAHGIIELYGFRIPDPENPIPVLILEWDGEKYQEKHILFNGRDFFPAGDDIV